jgi:hypothetical protein
MYLFQHVYIINFLSIKIYHKLKSFSLIMKKVVESKIYNYRFYRRPFDSSVKLTESEIRCIKNSLTYFW